jgi:hypothetical protein
MQEFEEYKEFKEFKEKFTRGILRAESGCCKGGTCRAVGLAKAEPADIDA